MTSEYICYGNVIAQIEEVPPELKDEGVHIGSLGVFNQVKANYHCEFIHYDTLINFMPKGLLNIKKNLVGYYLNEFITIMPEYGLLARSVLGTNRTIIGLREGMLNRRSAYLLQSEVRRHIHRHMFFEKHIPLHASGVIVSNQSQESILVIGPSGSGKSTLIWLLYQCGYLLLTDDNLVTDEQGKIYGAGGDILVRPDFFDLYGDQDREEVSPNQKYSIPVQNVSNCATAKAILFPFINPDMKSELKMVSAEEVMPRFMEAHIGWVFSAEEKRAIERSFHLLTSDAKIALVSIGKEPLEMMELLRNFCESA